MIKFNESKDLIQKEAEEFHIKYNCRSTIALSVGLGKTRLAINRIIKKFEENKNAKVIITSSREVYVSNFKKEIEIFERHDLLEKITFCCNKSLKKFEDSLWDLIIVDESHLEISIYLPFISLAFAKNQKIEILCLTGTPKMSKEYEELYQIAPISYSKKIDTSIEEGLLNDYMIHIFNYELTGTEFKNYNYWYQRYRQSEKRGFSFELQKIKSILNNLPSKVDHTNYLLKNKLKDRKVLVYAGCIKQSELLKIPTFHSDLKKEQRNEIYDGFYNDLFLHLINVSGLKESVSIPGLSRGILMSIESSEISMTQKIGRFCRLALEDKAHIIILCAENTVEKNWLNNALKKLDKGKIKNYNFEEWIKL